MADIENALIDAAEVITRLNLKPRQVETGGDSGDLLSFINQIIVEQSVYIQGRIGASDYDTDNLRQRQNVRTAEMLLVCAAVMEQLEVNRYMINEDAYPMEYMESGRLSEVIAGWREKADEILTSYEDAGEELGEATPAGFAIGGVGIDEIEEDDYGAIDYGTFEES